MVDDGGISRSGSNTSSSPKPVEVEEMHFVNLFGTPKHNKEKAKAVRSHVMRLVRRKQTENSSKKTRNLDILPCPKRTTVNSRSPKARGKEAIKLNRPSTAPSQSRPTLSIITKWLESQDSGEGAENFEHNSIGPGVSIKSLTAQALHDIATAYPSTDLQNGQSEIFKEPPIPLVARLHQNHKLSTTDNPRQPVRNNHQSLIPTTVRSPALLNITLSWDAAYIGRGNSEEEIESAVYLQEALGSINHALANSSVGVEDSTIAAVACLTNMENLNGDNAKAQIHMRGLKSLVEMRGGIDAISKCGTLQRLVLWADLCHATRWESQPSFAFVAFPNLPCMSIFLPTTAPNPLLCLYDRIINTAIFAGFTDLLPLLQKLHELGLFLDSTDPADTTILNNAAYVDRVYVEEHRNLGLMEQYRLSPPSLQSGTLDSNDLFMLPLLFQALMLYIYTNIRLTAVESAIRSTLVERIQASLSLLSCEALSELFQSFPHEVIWIIFLTGSAATSDDKRQYFAAHLRWMCDNLELVYWEDVEAELRRFLWLHAEYLERCRELWTDAVLRHVSVDEWDMMNS